jgi:hypothetical protein
MPQLEATHNQIIRLAVTGLRSLLAALSVGGLKHNMSAPFLCVFT